MHAPKKSKAVALLTKKGKLNAKTAAPPTTKGKLNTKIAVHIACTLSDARSEEVQGNKEREIKRKDSRTTNDKREIKHEDHRTTNDERKIKHEDYCSMCCVYFIGCMLTIVCRFS